MREIRPYGSEGGGGETLPTPICSRWLRSVSDDTTGRRRDIRSCTPAGVPAAFFLDLMTGRCRFAQPPATICDASGIILIRRIMCGRDDYRERQWPIFPELQHLPETVQALAISSLRSRKA